MTPALSIGLPVYNGERFLAHTLACLRQQEFADVEVMIADNASTDRTEEIAREAAAADPRIRYVRHATNLGAHPNFNYVFHETRGEFFAWLPCDDLFDPAFYGRMVELLRERPDAASAMSRVRLVDADGKHLGYADERVRSDHPDIAVRFAEMASFRHYCQYSVAVHRRSAMEQTRLLMPFWTADRLFCAELALQGPMLREPAALFFVRQHTERMTKRVGRSDWEALRTYLTPTGSRALTLYYAHQLREAVRLADLLPATRRRVRLALTGWAVRNSHRLGRSAARRALELVTGPYAESHRRS